MGKDSRRRIALSVALLAACPALMLVFSRYGEALFPAYRQAQKRFVALQATVAGVVPFALWDMVTVVLTAAFVISFVRRIRRKRPLAPLVTRALLLVALSVFLYVAWGLNHYAPPLASELSLEVGEYATEELVQTTSYYLEQAADRAREVPRNDDGSLAHQDFYQMATVAGVSYEGLGQEYEVFDGVNMPVKALLVAGEPLLYTGHTGIFWAPTGEASVPLNCADADLPFIMCHEAAHRLGIASEQEANFSAFLACAASKDVRFAYAGYYAAFVYCFNALARADESAAQAVLQGVGDSHAEGVDLVLADWTSTSAHYDAYRGPMREVGSTVNDAYLKSFGEQAGVRSYGLVVDYLIAWRGRG